jgi:endonuclease/exonuclease/phosphatase family metal-dependent hydrolase/dienelactone hydrolase
MKLFCLSMIALYVLSIFSCKSRDQDSKVKAEAEAPETFRAISYNILQSQGFPQEKAARQANREQIAAKIAAQLAIYRPDIIALSESPEEALTLRIASHLGMHHVRFKSNHSFQLPGTLLSRFAIVETRDFLDLLGGEPTPTNLFTRHWGSVTLDIGDGKTIIVHSVHLSPQRSPMNLEIDTINRLTSTDRQDNKSILLMGDLNFQPHWPEHAKFIGAGWIDGFQAAGQGNGLTIPSTRPNVRIDYLMASGPIARKIVGTRALFERGFRSDPDNPESYALSDHLPVYTEIRTSAIPAVTDLRGVPQGSKILDSEEGPSSSQIVRGQLTGLEPERRLLPAYYDPRNIGTAFLAALDGKEHFGMGERPPQDSMNGRWWDQSAEKIPMLRDEWRERIFSAITSQSGGDPRKRNVSWTDVTFRLSRWLTWGGRRVLKYEFQFPTGILGMHVTGDLLIPESVVETGKPAPAVIYQHFHGGLQHIGPNEMYWNWQYDGLESPAVELTKRGYIVIATDVHGFHRRRLTDKFRDGRSEESRIVQQFNREMPDIQDELSDTEIMFTHGLSRYGIRSHEDYLVYRLIKSHPLVNPKKLATMGMSMGGVRANTLGALAGIGLKVVVANGTFPRMYLATDVNGNYRIHSHRNNHHLIDQLIKFSVDTEHLSFLTAETGYLAQMGATDPSSPGFRQVFAMIDELKPFSAGTIRTTISPGGHTFTKSNLLDAYNAFEAAFEGI